MARNPNKIRCKGKSRQTGEPCKLWATPGRDYCRFHGGRNPVGKANGQYKHGKYMRWGNDLPSRLGEKLQSYMQDGDPHDLEAEIALIDLGIGDLVSKLDSGESMAAWQAAIAAYDEVMTAIAEQDTSAMQSSLTTLGSILRSGPAHMDIWAEIKSMADQKRKIVESNRRAVKEREEMLDRRQQAALMGAIAAAVARSFSSDEEKRRFAYELEGILNKP